MGLFRRIVEMVQGPPVASQIPVVDLSSPTSDRGPSSFDDLVGQETARRILRVKLDSHRYTGNPPSHMLFTGGPGLGKTATARVFARSMGTSMHYIMCPELKSWSSALDVFRSVRDGDVVFLDEIHALKPAIQERLYRVLTDFATDEFATGRFTAIGATTHSGRVNKALKSRLSQEVVFEPYSVAELAEIAVRHVRREHGLELPLDVAHRLGSLSRREARRVVALSDAMVESAASVAGRRPRSEDMGQAALALTIECANIDPVLGLDAASRRYLVALHRLGRPASAETISKLIGEELDNVKYHIEPFLMRGSPDRGGAIVEIVAPHGRCLTAAGSEFVRSNLTKEADAI